MYTVCAVYVTYTPQQQYHSMKYILYTRALLLCTLMKTWTIGCVGSIYVTMLSSGVPKRQHNIHLSTIKISCHWSPQWKQHCFHVSVSSVWLLKSYIMSLANRLNIICCAVLLMSSPSSCPIKVNKEDLYNPNISANEHCWNCELCQYN